MNHGFEVVRKYFVPRWYYTTIDVPISTMLRIEPDAFANSTRHRMRLLALTFGYPYPTTDAFSQGQPNLHPAWTNQLLVDIGKSGVSDVNLVSGTLTSLCATPRRTRTTWGDENVGRSFRLNSPYMLPRDEGLRVSAESIFPQYSLNGVAVGPSTTGELTFIAKGYGVDGYPRMLAGRCDALDTTHRGDAVLLNSADLFNNGKTAMWITEFCFKERDIYRNAGLARYFKSGNGCNLAWQVNPTNPSFTQFMPQPRHIPTGLLTPSCRSLDGGMESPLAYWFPQDTFLDPKQAVSVRIGNTSTTENVILHVCLIAEVEVK